MGKLISFNTKKEINTSNNKKIDEEFLEGDLLGFPENKNKISKENFPTWMGSIVDKYFSLKNDLENGKTIINLKTGGGPPTMIFVNGNLEYMPEDFDYNLKQYIEGYERGLLTALGDENTNIASFVRLEKMNIERLTSCLKMLSKPKGTIEGIKNANSKGMVDAQKDVVQARIDYLNTL